MYNADFCVCMFSGSSLGVYEWTGQLDTNVSFHNPKRSLHPYEMEKRWEML